MTLLDHYLGAVGMYLPKGSDRRDILAELRGHLESNMDERAAELGRGLTESEQQAVLAEFGDPFTVATRYGKAGRGFALGPFQLISPQAFPVYVGVLIFVLAINVIIGSVETVLTGVSFVALVRRLVVTMLVLFLVFTLVFAGLDFFLRRSGTRQRGAPESWLFYTPYLKHVPKWYSASGLALFSAVALSWGLWWSAWPEVPALLVGPAVGALELAPPWQRFQLFLFALLLLGIAQRAFSLVRPDLNWLPWAVRLVINVLCVAMLYPILDSAPFVVVSDAAAASAEAVDLAQHINNATRGWIRGFGFYWVFNTLWIAFVCAGHIFYRGNAGDGALPANRTSRRLRSDGRMSTKNKNQPLRLRRPAACRTAALTRGATMAALVVAAMTLALVGCDGDASVGAKRLQLCEPDEGPRGAHCGALTVFEDRAAQSGRTIDLKIVVAPALRRNPAPDPLFVLVGGPTGGAATQAPSLVPAFRPYQRDRDIVFVDQRGTGASNPLDCEPPERTLAALVENPVERLQRCLEDLDADPRFYTTAPAVDDVDEVRRYLGYDLINLWGSSYGTRAALVYLARHEATVRSLVLDSAAPIDTPIALNMPRDAQRAIDRLIADCAAEAACAGRFGDLRATVNAVLDRAAAAPTIRMLHPRTGAPIEGTISRELIAGTILGALYAPMTASLLPQLLSDAERGDFQGLLSLRLIDGPPAPGTGEGAFFSVYCSEDAPRFTREDAVREASGTFLGTTPLDMFFKPCAFWPKGTVEADFYAAPVSEKPVLVLSGDLDPVLPPVRGEQVASSLPNARHVVVPGAGHMTSLTGCVPELIGEFFASPDADALDTSCLERLHRPPFVTSRTGGLNP